jgi:hypothetical protein
MLAIIVVEIMMIFEGDRLLIVKVMNVHIPFLFLNFFFGLVIILVFMLLYILDTLRIPTIHSYIHTTLYTMRT